MHYYALDLCCNIILNLYLLPSIYLIIYNFRLKDQYFNQILFHQITIVVDYLLNSE